MRQPSPLIIEAPRPRREISLWRAMRRGFARRCPNCGEGRLFRSYLGTTDNCDKCGEPFGAYRADDAPAYFTILIVGHLIVPGMLALEMAAHPPTYVHLALWLPLTLLLTLGLLPHVKGALIGLLWSHAMRP